jgi:death-on-curing protein
MSSTRCKYERKVQFGGQILHLTIFHLAAAYRFDLSQNHLLVDGYKHTAGMAMFTFLRLNGLELIASETEYYQTMMALASGQMSKEQLANWLQIVTTGPPA